MPNTLKNHNPNAEISLSELKNKANIMIQHIIDDPQCNLNCGQN